MIEVVGQRVYLVALPFPETDRAKAALGMDGRNFDKDRRQWWVGLAKREAAEKFLSALKDAPPAASVLSEDFDRQRVYAAVTYQGRRYYVTRETADVTRCYLVTLDGQGPGWVDCASCKLERTYTPTQFRGRTKYHTIGSLKSFRDQQKAAVAAGGEKCPDCGRVAELIEDLEDGGLKCRRCCDMPSS